VALAQGASARQPVICEDAGVAQKSAKLESVRLIDRRGKLGEVIMI
jgi:hypothetical protein